jgi:hypothetical protein
MTMKLGISSALSAPRRPLGRSPLMAERGILIVAIGSALFGLRRPAGGGPYAGRILQGDKACGLADHAIE